MVHPYRKYVANEGLFNLTFELNQRYMRSGRGHGGFGWRYGLIDLSSNVNPLGAPRELLDLVREAVEQGHFLHHPTELGDELREALAQYEGVGVDVTYVFNGASEALQLLTMYIRPRRVVIPIPNYGDYARMANLVGAGVELIEYWGSGDLLGKVLGKVMPNSLLVLSNPNTPMGYLISRDELLALLDELGRRGAVVIVDESFMDFVEDEQSLVRECVRYENLIVVKSYTKFLAVPGLRVGAVYAKTDLEDLVPTWPINSITEYAVSRYMRHARAFRERTVAYVKEERARVLKALDSLGIQYYDSTTHYFVIRHEPWLDQELRKRKILIRDLSNTPPLTKGYFRISLRSREVNDELIRALTEIKQIK